MTHLSPDQLSALVDDSLSGDVLNDARAHLADCSDCRNALAQLQAQDDALFAAKAEMPSDAYFASFATRVQDGINELDAGAAAVQPVDDTLPLEGAPPPRSAGAPWWATLFGWFQSPGRVAWAGGVAVIVVGAGIAFMTLRETGVLSLRDSEVGQAMDQTFRDEAKQVTPEAQKTQARQNAERAGGLREADDVAGGTRGDVAPPSRAREMRRTESGEDVPVDRNEPRFAREPAEEAAPQTAPGAPAFVKKPRVASPLAGRTAAESEAPAKSLDAKDAAKEETSKRLQLQSKVEGSRLCGQVHDVANRPLAGAQVVLADRGKTTTTDADGRFCIESGVGTQTLTVMAVGFETLRRSIDVEAANEPLAVKLDAVDVLGKSKQSGSASALSPSALAPGGAKRAFDEDGLSISEDAAVAMREAQRLTTKATRDKKASGWDTAAEAWSKSAGMMPVGSMRNDASYQEASARMQAWDLDRTEKRRSAALNAVETFLTVAPKGSRRTEAEGWKAELRSS